MPRLIFTPLAVVLVSAGAGPSAPAATTEGWTTTIVSEMQSVRGNGRVTRENRPVAAFNRVETLGSAMVLVRVGPKPSLVISGEENILPLLSTDVRGGTLRIGLRGSFQPKRPIRIVLTTPNLVAFRTVGSGSAIIEGINNDRLALIITGSGDIRASGRTRDLRLVITGSGKADLANLTADSVQVALHGNGNATLREGRKMNALVPGTVPRR